MANARQVKLNWISGLPVTGKSARIPGRSGVYAYGIVRHSAGLVAEVQWVYIGKANSLRQRITTHDIRFETNPDLQKWLRKPPANAELWFAEVSTKDVDFVEQQLIGDINPRFNSKHRTNKKSKSTQQSHKTLNTERTVAS
jgi:excinuclease UvrABC nuclease subunit